MALLESCFCCSLAIAAGFLAVYLLIAFLIAFGFELLWILESEAALPTAAVLLCVGYFTLALFAAILVHGLATKNTVCLVVWMFAVSVLIFPEAGMVIYMSIQYWRIESQYGITELVCWFARILANVIEIIIIQSLYSIWKEEELVTKRLRDLNVMIPIPRETSLNSVVHNSIPAYQNNAFEGSIEQLNSNIKRMGSMPQLWNGNIPNNLASLPFEGYQFCTTQSEFNASIFVPNYVNEDAQLPPAKKAQSLMDLRTIEDSLPLGNEKFNQQWQPWMSQSITETSSVILPNYTKSTEKPRISKYASVDALNDINRNHHIIKNRTGFYAQPIANYGVPIYYGPLDGPDFLIYKKKLDKLNSKNSISNTSVDDVQKYRDVAL
ncbi:hypothetical protein PPYR_14096 [Photinus pyralis]|uniref:Uncharacterized protein n=1 Tax=Photinus pyralis TaxID=7054 RepID=A0A1Y1KKI1_PHOPY|nr:uncharacterized protein LOC116180172 [Photinus pyralis]KAB0792135.1 hypothetical protein PPYR_14096 [Photinus pyralis]